MTSLLRHHARRFTAAVCAVVLTAGGLSAVAGAGLTTNDQMADRLNTASQASHIQLHEIGRSVEGRPLWAMRITRPDDQKAVDAAVVLLIGQQHGNEPAGAEALLDLIDDLAARPETIIPGLDLWVVPRVNPDGAHVDARRNANDADLNRDHVILAQPETKALHRLAQRIKPHIAVDCHEFRRDTGDYLDQGWTEWPLIMMDTANLAIMPEPLYDLGVEVCVAAAEDMDAAGFNYGRYLVGSCPDPQATGELRYSTLDPDDCRNGLSTHGTLSFIIESGIHRQADDPLADLPRRVAAYRQLLSRFVSDASLLQRARQTAESARVTEPFRLIPTNVMWANLTPRLTEVPVIDRATGGTLTVSTPTVMHDRVVKRAVPAPTGYLIHADAAEPFGSLLHAHALPFNRLDSPATFDAEVVSLERMEDEFDAVYARYAGRQITTPLAAALTPFPAGSLVVNLSDLSPLDARRAALVLEPRQLHGLYQWPTYLNLIRTDGTLPVARLLADDAVGSSTSLPLRRDRP